MPSELLELFLCVPGGGTDALGTRGIGSGAPMSWLSAPQQHNLHRAPPCLKRAPDTRRGGGGNLGISLGWPRGIEDIGVCWC